MKIYSLIFLGLFSFPLFADADTPVRPHITGIAHAAFYVTDMVKARAFYEGYLGFQSPFSIPRKTAGESLVWLTSSRPKRRAL